MKPAIGPAAPADLLGTLADGAERLLTLDRGGFAVEWARVRGLPPGELRDTLARLLLRRWGQVDHEAALAAVAATGGLDLRERATYEQYAVDGWTLVEPDAAWASAREAWEKLPAFSAVGGPVALSQSRSGPSGEGRFRGIARFLIETEEYAVAGRLIADAPAEATGSAAAALATAWGRIDPSATQEWVLTLKGNALYNAARVIANILAEREPAAAASFLERTSLSPVGRSQALMTPEQIIQRSRDEAAAAAARRAAGGN